MNKIKENIERKNQARFCTDFLNFVIAWFDSVRVSFSLDILSIQRTCVARMMNLFFDWFSFAFIGFQSYSFYVYSLL